MVEFNKRRKEEFLLEEVQGKTFKLNEEPDLSFKVTRATKTVIHEKIGDTYLGEFSYEVYMDGSKIGESFIGGSLLVNCPEDAVNWIRHTYKQKIKK